MKDGSRYLVTGGAGFIGSCLVERLQKDARAVVFDNLRLGKVSFIQSFVDAGTTTFVHDDLLNLESLIQHTEGVDTVFHMAANSDISQGRKETDLDLRLGTLVTYNVLEAMRRTGVRDLVFASTSAVYGDNPPKPTGEDCGPLFPISLYGASKLASEGLISAFVANYGLRAWIFRFGNVVGRHPTHGVIHDFVKRLLCNSSELEILGDGRQAKPYLHVDECVDGMLFGYAHATEDLNCFNLSCEGATSVRSIAERVVAEMGLNDVTFRFTGGRRGWPGDVPQVRMDATRLARLGWSTKRSSDEAVQAAVREIVHEIRSAQCKS